MKLRLTQLSVLFALLGGASLLSGQIISVSNFSTFSDGDLVGQNGWQQAGTPSGSPVQVSNGRVILPGANTSNQQDVGLNFTSTITPGATFYHAFRLSVTGRGGVPIGMDGAYLTTLTSGPFENSRFTIRPLSETTYQFAFRPTGQDPNPYVTGGPTLNFGSDIHTVLIGHTFATGSDPDVSQIWINPASASSSPSFTYINSGSAFTNPFSRMLLSQFTNDGSYEIFAMGVGTDGDALLAAVPEPGLSGLILGIVLMGWMLQRRRRKN